MGMKNGMTRGELRQCYLLIHESKTSYLWRLMISNAIFHGKQLLDCFDEVWDGYEPTWQASHVTHSPFRPQML
jgi:hypothetical protein